jgi:hypothetical protein
LRLSHPSLPEAPSARRSGVHGSTRPSVIPRVFQGLLAVPVSSNSRPPR